MKTTDGNSVTEGMPVLDLTMLEEVYEDDTAGMLELLGIAQRTIGDARPVLANAIAKRALEVVRSSAHGIKGALLNVGGHEAARVASAIEQRARSGEWEPLGSLANDLDSALARFDAAVASYRVSVS